MTLSGPVTHIESRLMACNMYFKSKIDEVSVFCTRRISNTLPLARPVDYHLSGSRGKIRRGEAWREVQFSSL